jgi:hypothetical protein
MRFWTREVAGWVLVALGLFVFYKCYGLLTADDHRLVEGSAMTLVGLIIFRGGIHLLKVAVAAQVSLEALGRAEADRPSAHASRLPKRTVTSNVHRPVS